MPNWGMLKTAEKKNKARLKKAEKHSRAMLDWRLLAEFWTSPI
jgi:hypothetical protein